ncbi:TAXI family TRAP transporter solute-binding subunit [Salirhabdus salicampi]|uniref:TAXI family TRAP transporter solute-binding subunit n=1 Tax=Salirhabdus salicampi TaxID=476102 RepID=UPI0020C1D5D5|nr:TAXI family TRAP transporter solute-binding subunit [Salirhabdus salicampi]MCP8615916.1 TAXI family TRAP transporter solute-binding subunit [Salirhabdus salicampi]
MNRKKVMQFISVIALMLLLAACGNSETSGNNSSSANLSMSLGGTSGTFYIQGSSLAEYVNENSDSLRVIPSTSGGSVENTRLVGSGEAQIGMSFSGDLYNAWQGEDPYENELKDFYELGPAQQISGWNFIVLADSGVDTLEDLVGKTFSPGAPGSGSAAGADLLLKEAGLSDDIKTVYNAWGELPGMLKNGDIQGFNRTGGVPIPVAQEIDVTHPMKILDLKPYMDQTNFLEKYPYFTEFVIPAGSYEGQDSEAVTFGMDVKWVIHKDVPDDAVREFLELSYTEEASSHLDNVYPQHNHRAESIQPVIPLHPVAEEFWTEKGLDLADPLLSK